MVKAVKTYWVNYRGTEGYNKNVHSMQVWNFLLWPGENGNDAVLIAGDGDYHVIHEIRHPKHFDLRRCAADCPVPIIPETEPIGGGQASNGKILDWKIYGQETPFEFRQVILESLGLTQ